MGNTNFSQTENYIEKFYVSIPSVEIENYLKVGKDENGIISIGTNNLKGYFDMVEQVTSKVAKDTLNAERWKKI